MWQVCVTAKTVSHDEVREDENASSSSSSSHKVASLKCGCCVVQSTLSYERPRPTSLSPRTSCETPLTALPVTLAASSCAGRRRCADPKKHSPSSDRRSVKRIHILVRIRKDSCWNIRKSATYCDYNDAAYITSSELPILTIMWANDTGSHIVYTNE